MTRQRLSLSGYFSKSNCVQVRQVSRREERGGRGEGGGQRVREGRISFLLNDSSGFPCVGAARMHARTHAIARTRMQLTGGAPGPGWWFLTLVRFGLQHMGRDTTGPLPGYNEHSADHTPRVMTQYSSVLRSGASRCSVRGASGLLRRCELSMGPGLGPRSSSCMSS